MSLSRLYNILSKPHECDLYQRCLADIGNTKERAKITHGSFVGTVLFSGLNSLYPNSVLSTLADVNFGSLAMITFINVGMSASDGIQTIKQAIKKEKSPQIKPD